MPNFGKKVSVNPFEGKKLQYLHDLSALESYFDQEIIAVLYEEHLQTTTSGSLETQAGITILTEYFEGVDLLVSKLGSDGVPTQQDIFNPTGDTVAANFNPPSTPPNWQLSSASSSAFALVFAVRGSRAAVNSYLEANGGYHSLETIDVDPKESHREITGNFTVTRYTAKTILVNTAASGGTVTVSLDTTIQEGTYIKIIDTGNNAETNTILVSPTSGLIDSAASASLNVNNGGIVVYATGGNYWTLFKSSSGVNADTVLYTDLINPNSIRGNRSSVLAPFEDIQLQHYEVLARTYGDMSPKKLEPVLDYAKNMLHTDFIGLRQWHGGILYKGYLTFTAGATDEEVLPPTAFWSGRQGNQLNDATDPLIPQGYLSEGQTYVIKAWVQGTTTSGAASSNLTLRWGTSNLEVLTLDDQNTSFYEVTFETTIREVASNTGKLFVTAKSIDHNGDTQISFAEYGSLDTVGENYFNLFTSNFIVENIIIEQK